MKVKTYAILVQAVLVAAMAGANCFAKQTAVNKSLVGINKMVVDVCLLVKFDEAQGIKDEDITKEISQQLREAGIKVVDRADLSQAPGQARLELIIKGYQLPGQRNDILSLDLRFNQKASLARNPEIEVNATTWELTRLADGRGHRFTEAIQGNVRIMVNEFIRDCRAANPKDTAPADVNDVSTAIPKKRPEPIAKPAPAEYEYVASKNSKVFHKPDCSSAKRISPKNLVGFDGRGEAVETGRRPCKRCKP